MGDMAEDIERYELNDDEDYCPEHGEYSNLGFDCPQCEDEAEKKEKEDA